MPVFGGFSSTGFRIGFSKFNLPIMGEDKQKNSDLIDAGGTGADKTGAVDAEKIKHIAHLARIGIADEDADRYALQMNSVLDYMKILEEVDTTAVEMTLQVNGLNNVTRPDEVRTEEKSADLLGVSPLPKISGQIAVRAVIKED